MKLSIERQGRGQGIRERWGLVITDNEGREAIFWYLRREDLMSDAKRLHMATSMFVKRVEYDRVRKRQWLVNSRKKK